MLASLLGALHGTTISPKHLVDGLHSREAVFDVANRFCDLLNLERKAKAGLNAQAKGRRLGIFKPHEEKAQKAREKERGERFWIEVCGRAVPATNTDDGIRAMQKGKPIDPDSVRHYLENKFGDDLKAVQSAMKKLAKAYKPQELAHDAYPLYERFRPVIPEGVKGWGAKGDLDLGLIEQMAKDKP
jgi:hypothetical protein